MSFAMGMYLRETSLRFKKTMENLTMVSINNINKTSNQEDFRPQYNDSGYSNPWTMQITAPDGQIQNQDISWLL
jgi:hypothetical protein